MTDMFVPYAGLRNFGIRWSEDHIRRLVRLGEFPKPVRLARRNMWIAAEIEDFVCQRIAARAQHYGA